MGNLSSEKPGEGGGAGLRLSKRERVTSETSIRIELNLDGSGSSSINTGIGFFDHMLNLFAKHGLFDLKLDAEGDLKVDFHHTVEDVGILLGQAFAEAVGDKAGIKRYGFASVVMDEAWVIVSLDFSGRAFLEQRLELSRDKVGEFDTELVSEFLRAFVSNSGITLHIRQMAGENTHHIIEALFKALGRALDDALLKDPRITGVMSTKGVL